MTTGKVSRRLWFKNLIPEATEHVARQATGGLESLAPRRRPPGAVDEREFLRACTRCMKCVEACEYKAVHTLAQWVGIGGGTPVMVPDSRPCRLCEAFPCAAACPEGALIPPAEGWKLGEVVLDAGACLPYQGPECGACAGLCPSDPAAITLRLGRPQVSADDCTGCGLCIEACPTTPKALRLRPLSLVHERA